MLFQHNGHQLIRTVVWGGLASKAPLSILITAGCQASVSEEMVVGRSCRRAACRVWERKPTGFPIPTLCESSKPWVLPSQHFARAQNHWFSLPNTCESANPRVFPSQHFARAQNHWFCPPNTLRERKPIGFPVLTGCGSGKAGDPGCGGAVRGLEGAGPVGRRCGGRARGRRSGR